MVAVHKVTLAALAVARLRVVSLVVAVVAHAALAAATVTVVALVVAVAVVLAATVTAMTVASVTLAVPAVLTTASAPKAVLMTVVVSVVRRAKTVVLPRAVTTTASRRASPLLATAHVPHLLHAMKAAALRAAILLRVVISRPEATSRHASQRSLNPAQVLASLLCPTMHASAQPAQRADKECKCCLQRLH